LGIDPRLIIIKACRHCCKRRALQMHRNQPPRGETCRVVIIRDVYGGAMRGKIRMTRSDSRLKSRHNQSIAGRREWASIRMFAL